jgi:hypothetical protein
MARGKCHLCNRQTDVDLCDECQHWFCAPCRDSWFKVPRRVFEAALYFAGWEKENCCGPEERSDTDPQA